MLRAGNASFQKSPCFALENPTQKKTGRLTSSKASIISKAGCQKKKTLLTGPFLPMCHYLQVVSSEKLETRKGQVVIGMKEQERKKK